MVERLRDAPVLSGPWAMGDLGPRGRFGSFGGCFVPEALVPACEELEAAFRAAWADAGFRSGLAGLHRSYAGRPTPVTEAARLSGALGVRVLLKREDLAHTGSHKINNALGQALLAQRIGKTALVAETGAGQHGVATATVAAHLGLGCTVYMGAKDIARQELNVFRMELLGATVVPVTSGARTLKDATSEALRHWVTTVRSTHYCIGSVLGPHPYPWLVREFQRVIGDEARAQCAELLSGGWPDVVVACVGGGSNAAGTFAGPVLIGFGIDTPGRAADTVAAPDDVGARFGAAGEVLRLRRLRLADGAPVIVQTSYLPAELAAALDPADLCRRGLYTVLAEHGRAIGRTSETITPATLSIRDARDLDRPEGGPALLSHQVSFTTADLPVVDDHALLAGDSVAITANRAADHLDVHYTLAAR